MIGVDATQLNAWAKLTYCSPEDMIGTLQLFRGLTPSHRVTSAAQARKLGQWRVAPLAKYLEREQAAWFCWLLNQRTPDFRFQFAHAPESDYDFILRCHVRGEKKPWFKPVQLKELVPSDLNPLTNLQAEIDKLQKYCAAPNLVVAIHINRTGVINFKVLKIPPLGIGQLWIFGNSSPEEMFLCGDLLTAPHAYYYPTPVIPLTPPVISQLRPGRICTASANHTPPLT